MPFIGSQQSPIRIETDKTIKVAAGYVTRHGRRRTFSGTRKVLASLVSAQS